MLAWLQRLRPAPLPSGRRPPIDVSDKRRILETKDLELQVEGHQLKIDAIRRVVESTADPLTALEVVTVATHRGKLPPNLAPRRGVTQSPLEAMAMQMLQQRLSEDPSEALERILDRRERLEEAADRLSGGSGRRRQDDDATGNTLIDTVRAVANSPLGEAIGTVLGQGLQQHMAAASAAAAGGGAGTRPPSAPVVTVADPLAGGDPSSAAGPVPPSLASPQVAVGLPVPAPAAAPRPNWRVGLALRMLASLDAPAGARFFAGQAEQSPELEQILGTLVAADVDQVPALLEALAAEAGADPELAQWLPLVAWLQQRPEWTAACHAELRRLLDQVQDDDQEQDLEPDDEDLGPRPARGRQVRIA